MLIKKLTAEGWAFAWGMYKNCTFCRGFPSSYKDESNSTSLTVSLKANSLILMLYTISFPERKHCDVEVNLTNIQHYKINNSQEETPVALTKYFAGKN